MPLIEKAISYLSPRWSVQRQAWRKIENSYRGGEATRLSESWQRADGYRFGTSIERQQIAEARDRAYHAYRNNPVARTLVQTETDNVIGDGLNYQPTSSSEAWNREAKDRYYRWLENCSVRGPDIHSGCEIQRLLWDRSRVAGDIGWVLVAKDFIDPVTKVLTVDSRIQIVQAENIATPDGLGFDTGVYDGIRYDAWGRPVAYYVKLHNDLGVRKFEGIPARDFVYLGHMTDANQARSETAYMTIFDTLSNLERYIDGVSLAAWMGTVFGIIFKQTNSGTQFNDLLTVPNSAGNEQKAVTLENGSVKYVGTEDEVAQVQAHQPMQQAPDFIRAIYRTLGQPFDMPLEVIAKDMSTCTFASARIGLLPFYRSCRIKAARFGSRWSRTINWWLSRERHRSPSDPKRWDNAFPADFFNHDLLVNEWQYTDPVSEPQSDLLQIDMGTKSVQQVIAERGRDYEQILRERREHIEKTKDLSQINSTMTRHPQSGVGATGDPLGKEAVEPPKPAAEPAGGRFAGNGKENTNGDE